MQLARPTIALDPKSFGKRRVRRLASASGGCSTLAADIKLFAATFLAGFVFVSILIS
jgi:hypothetical protein